MNNFDGQKSRKIFKFLQAIDYFMQKDKKYHKTKIIMENIIFPNYNQIYLNYKIKR